ncbi:homoserine kinase [Enterococcus asini]|uniref:homoserine kinase n=1 Tax=Enterococcus TaxID=1350 RepID=UPI00288E937C|nr:homoserine kinase [Enterococcus asini]MDT2756523.1 homoserine kinase [Enterococcus asini]
MRIRVPATSANLGPGFDSCGIALDRYLVIDVVEDSFAWQIDHELGPEIPTDERNLLLETALRLAPDLTPKRIKMTSDIPVTRGLGSSSSVIVAGIELANRLGNLNLSESEKVEIATEIEGHPDNVSPAICGDLVVASSVDSKTTYVRHYFPDCAVIAYIPKTALSTTASRKVLPETLAYKEAVAASSIANVMVAALITGNLPVAGQMMEADHFHEKYRQDLVPHLTMIREIGHEEGAYGCYLSGAGPTVMMLAPENRAPRIMQLLQALEQDATVELLNIDREGAQVF